MRTEDPLQCYKIEQNVSIFKQRRVGENGT